MFHFGPDDMGTFGEIRKIIIETGCSHENLQKFKLPKGIFPSSNVEVELSKSFSECSAITNVINKCSETLIDDATVNWILPSGGGKDIRIVQWASEYFSIFRTLLEICAKSPLDDVQIQEVIENAHDKLLHMSEQISTFEYVLKIYSMSPNELDEQFMEIIVTKLIGSSKSYPNEMKFKAAQFKNMVMVAEDKGCIFGKSSIEILLKILFDAWDCLSSFIELKPTAFSIFLRKRIVSAEDGTHTFEEDTTKIDIFVDLIQKHLCSRLQKNTAAFAYYFTLKIHLSSSKYLESSLFQRLIEFLHKQPFGAFILNHVFCNLISGEMKRCRLVNDDETASYKLFHPSGDSRNAHVHRYLQQIALLVIAEMAGRINRTPTADSDMNFFILGSLSRFLRIIHDTVALHSIVFVMKDKDWLYEDLREEQELERLLSNKLSSIQDFENNPGSTHCRLFLPQEVQKNAEKFLFLCLDHEVTAAFEVYQVRRLTTLENRNNLICLHPWFDFAGEVRRAFFGIESDGDQKQPIWYSFFYAILDHYEKLKPEHNKQPAEDTFHSWMDTLELLWSVANEPGIYVRSHRFQPKIVQLLIEYIHSWQKDTLIDQVFEKLKVRVERLYAVLEKLTTSTEQGGVGPMDLDDIVTDGTKGIKAIMEDDIQEATVFGSTQLINDFILKEVIEPHEDRMGKKIGLFGESLVDLKPRLLVELNAAKNSSLIALQKVSDFRQLCEDYKVTFDSTLHQQTLKAPEVLWAICYQTIRKILDQAVREKNADAVHDLLRKFDSDVERQIAHYRYDLKSILKATKKFNASLEDLKNSDVEEFITNTKNTVSGALASMDVHKIEQFQNNQLVAMYLSFMPNEPRASVLKVGTGQGKTLIEACTAVLYLKRNRPSKPQCKVFIFTSFAHLAEKDQQAMKCFIEGMHYSSCFLTVPPPKIDAAYLSEVASRAVDCDIIYADSEVFLTTVQKVACYQNLSESAKFLELVHGGWDDHLVILDEVDVLLEKDEIRFVHDVHSFFAESTPLTVSMLQSGRVFSKINLIFNVEKNNIYFTDNSEGRPSGVKNQSDSTYNYAESLVKQLSSTPPKLLLCPSHFSLKWKLRTAARVIGFSGTVTKTNPALSRFLPDCFSFFEVPLFFSPEKKFGDVKCIVCHADLEKHLKNLLPAMKVKTEEGKTDEGDLPAKEGETIGSAIKEELLPDFKVLEPCVTAEQWLQIIDNDVTRALKDKQAVLIFARKENVADKETSKTPMVPKPIDALKARLKVDSSHIYDGTLNLTDAKLQEIASAGRVSICTKIVGRGADIRVSLGMEQGLHVIIAAADYPEEIMQQIGRTGRMNRKGSFSIIFTSDDTIPSYNKVDETEKFNESIRSLHDLSCFFFKDCRAKNWTDCQRKVFLWYCKIASIGTQRSYEQMVADLAELGIK